MSRKWPTDCIWPEPLWDGEGDAWDLDTIELLELDEDGEDLRELKDYFDDLVAEGRLNPDYSLNDDYGENHESAEGVWQPEKGLDYWDDGFDFVGWEEDLIRHVNMLKIAVGDPHSDPIVDVRGVIGYNFINENLLRQAFTRRSFGMEYGTGDNEALEFYGDMILSMVVTKELYQRFSDPYADTVAMPYHSAYQEGVLSNLRTNFISKDYLATRAVELGLDRFILYGQDEEPSNAACEDMMEALIGAVAVDSNWDWSLLADVVDRLLNLQLDNPGEILRKSAYEKLNTWHQKHFGCMPEYEVHRNLQIKGKERYDCSLRYYVPENDKGIRTTQRIYYDAAPTRSSAREDAADTAIRFLRNNGLWMNLSDSGIEPKLDESINQLQELYQKKYIENAPSYTFEERHGKEWYCSCICGDFDGWGIAVGKVKAKKKAAFMALVHMMMSAGICTDEWKQAMWETIK